MYSDHWSHDIPQPTVEMYHTKFMSLVNTWTAASKHLLNGWQYSRINIHAKNSNQYQNPTHNDMPNVNGWLANSFSLYSSCWTFSDETDQYGVHFNIINNFNVKNVLKPNN